MPRRSFDDSYWGDPFVQELNKDAKLLFAYLWTNKRCNSAGLYEITPKTIAFETGIEIENLPMLIEQLEEKVKWLKDENIIWVRNFLKHQPKSPQFLKSVAECLARTSSNGVVKEFLEYYGSLGVSIPYQYGMDKVSRGYGYTQELELEPEQALELEIDNTGKLKQTKYGQFKNVLLTDDEKQKLIDRFGEEGFSNRVEGLSVGIESKGYKYKSHYAAILSWERKDSKSIGKNAGVNRINSDDSDKYTKGKYGHMVQR